MASGDRRGDHHGAGTVVGARWGQYSRATRLYLVACLGRIVRLGTSYPSVLLESLLVDLLLGLQCLVLDRLVLVEREDELVQHVREHTKVD